MNDLAQKYKTLVDRLYDRTVSGELEWAINHKNDLETQSGGFSIRLKSYRDGEGQPFEAVEIYNHDEELIESFNDGTLSLFTPIETHLSSYYVKMESLRSQARRKALGADEALDTILEDLDDDIPF